MDASFTRQRHREQMRSRIRELAMRQFAEKGAAGLSMSAIAREMGLTQPALFRYVENRDALITDLVITAYEDFIHTLSISTELSPEEIFREQGKAMRGWALANPHHYQLIFGTPIPGYHAPKDQTEDVVRRLQEILYLPYTRLSAGNDEQPVRDNGWLVHHAVVGWTRLHGVLSLELAGHFNENLPDAKSIYDSELEILVAGLKEYLEDQERPH